MVFVDSDWFTACAAVELEWGFPIIAAVAAYFQYVKREMALHDEMHRRNLLGEWLNDDAMDPGVRWALVTERPVLIGLIQRKYRTYDVCRAAIQKCPEAIQFTHKVHPELSIIAIRSNPRLFEKVEDPTPEMCLEAVIQNPEALRDIPPDQRTPEVCLVAVRRNGRMLKRVPESKRTSHLCIVAVQQNGLALKYVKARTLPICIAAVTQNPAAIKYIDNPQPEVILAAVQGHLGAVAHHPQAAAVADDIAVIAEHITTVIQRLSE